MNPETARKTKYTIGAALIIIGVTVLWLLSHIGAYDSQQTVLEREGEVSSFSIKSGGVVKFYAKGVLPETTPDYLRKTLQQSSQETPCLAQKGIPHPYQLGEFIVSSWETWEEANIHKQHISC